MGARVSAGERGGDGLARADAVADRAARRGRPPRALAARLGLDAARRLDGGLLDAGGRRHLFPPAARARLRSSSSRCATAMAAVFYMGFALVYRRVAGRLDPRLVPWAAAAAWVAAEWGRGRLLQRDRVREQSVGTARLLPARLARAGPDRIGDGRLRRGLRDRREQCRARRARAWRWRTAPVGARAAPIARLGRAPARCDRGLRRARPARGARAGRRRARRRRSHQHRPGQREPRSSLERRVLRPQPRGLPACDARRAGRAPRRHRLLARERADVLPRAGAGLRACARARGERGRRRADGRRPPRRERAARSRAISTPSS